MKRLLAFALLALACSAGIASARGIGVGFYGGQSIPILQDDVAKGNMYGVRVPVSLIPFLSIEPFYASTNLGDKTTDVAGLSYTRQGFDEKAYGANALLSVGGPVQFYPFAGIGQTQLTRPGSDAKLTTYNFGLGLGLAPVPKFALHIRGEMQVAADGQASRKFGNVTVGATYSLFSMP